MSNCVVVGELRITLLNVGDCQLSMASVLDVSPPDWQGRYDDVFERPLIFPTQSVLIQHPKANILVDACGPMPPDSLFAIEGYTPPPDLIAQINKLGLGADHISHVVLTHAHFDHLCGLIHYVPESAKPIFKNAAHYVGEADWKSEILQQHLIESFGQPTPLDVLHVHQLLKPVTAKTELVDGISIVPTPGETPGHLALRAQSGSETLYAVGDLFHHPIEALEPSWASSWSDKAACLASRNAMFKAALRENALLAATHIEGFGRFERQYDQILWSKAKILDDA